MRVPDKLLSNPSLSCVRRAMPVSPVTEDTSAVIPKLGGTTEHSFALSKMLRAFSMPEIQEEK